MWMVLCYLALNTLSDKQIKFQNPLNVKRISSQIPSIAYVQIWKWRFFTKFSKYANAIHFKMFRPVLRT